MRIVKNINIASFAVREIEIEEPALQLAALLATGSRTPITLEEMLLRWITFGMHHDCAGTRSIVEMEAFVAQHFKIKFK